MKKFLIICVSLLAFQLAALAQSKTVTGTVISAEDNLPVIGATVLNLTAGNNVGTITDVNGQYSIKVSPGDKLGFSFIGLAEQTITVGGENVINVELKADAISVDDVIVVGYGTRKKGTVTGSVATVSGKAIDSKPVVSFDQALQGQVAGVQIITASGEPSASSSVRIRGTSSMNASTAPLYIMDGVVIQEGDFTSFNNSDIENITVLKDASSTSIYGARAANGVIVITTKQGKFGEKATVKIRAQYGVANVIRSTMDMMNSRELLNFEKEVGVRTGDIESLAETDIDWTKLLYRMGQTQNYEISYSGGSDKSTYYVSGGYYGQEGIAKRSGLERFTLRTNNQTRINNWLKLGANLSLGYTMFTNTEQSFSTQNPSVASQTTKPYDNPYDENGELLQRFTSNDQVNPLSSINYHPQRNNDLKVVASVFAEVQPIKNLTIKSLFGVDGVDQRSSGKSLPGYWNNELTGGTANESFARSYRLTFTNTINYNLSTKSRHNVNFLLGQESMQYRIESFGASAGGIFDPRLPQMNSGTVAQLPSGGYSRGYSYLSVFGRAEYNYDYKYFVDVSIRGDGSSRFAKGKRWGAFWSVGLMWDMSAEKFLKGNSVLTKAKINASVGTSGNSEIDYYDYMSWVNSGPIYDNVGGMAAAAVPGNPNLTWESVTAVDFGVSLEFINRINLSVEGYTKRTSNMLLSVPISQVTGYSNMTQNVGELSNTGIEVDVNGDIVSTRSGFVFNLGTNFAYNHNKLLKLYEGSDGYLSSNTGTKYQEGQSLASFFLPRFAGVNPANGDALWYTKDNEVVNYASQDDAVFVNKSFVAPWNGGITASFSYKGIELSAFFNWMADKWVINNVRQMTENPGQLEVTTFNQSRYLNENMWRKPGDITDVPRASYVRPSFATTNFLEDASFLRLKNVTLAYNFPSKIVKKIRLQNLRLYAQGQNLFTWTKFKGFDPEDDANLTLGRYPTSRQFTIGIDISF